MQFINIEPEPAEITIINSNCFTDSVNMWGSKTKKGKYSINAEAMKKFTEESIKCQTLYSNCEGFYSTRTISCKDEDNLNSFLYMTMFYNVNETWETETNLTKRMIVEKFQKKIVSLSKQNADEVDLSVIWVVLLTIDKEHTMFVPVFKVYNDNLKNKATFLDFKLNCYQSWQDYLEKADLPPSFICFPRNGVYSCDCESGQLDLLFQYFESNKNVTHKIPKMQPFSVVAIRSRLNEINHELHEIKPYIVSGAIIMKDNFPSLMSLLYMALNLRKSGLTQKSSDEFLKAFDVMLLNITKTEDPAIDPTKESSSLSVYSSRKETSLSEFFEALTSGGQKFDKILEYSIKFLDKNCFTLFNLIGACNVPPLLPNILFFLSILLRLRKFWIHSKKNFKLFTSDLALQSSSSSSSSSSTNDAEATDKENEIETLALKKYLTELFNLENQHSSKIKEKVLKEAETEFEKMTYFISDNVSLPSAAQVLGTIDGFLVFICKSSIPLLVDVTRRLGVKNFSFKPRKELNWIIDVVDSNGQKVFTYYFPMETVAIGLLQIKPEQIVETAYGEILIAK